MSEENQLVSVSDVMKYFLMYTKGKLKFQIEKLPEEILQTSTEDLEKDQKITNTDKKLRLQLHNEVLKASEDQRTVQIQDICDGICHVNHFLRIIEQPKKLGWLLLPYQHENIRLAHQVIQAQDAVEEFLQLKLYDNEGKLDYKAAEFKWRAAKLIYDRKYPQKQVIQTINEDDKKKHDDIQKEIKQLEQELGKKIDGSK